MVRVRGRTLTPELAVHRKTLSMAGLTTQTMRKCGASDSVDSVCRHPGNSNPWYRRRTCDMRETVMDVPFP